MDVKQIERLMAAMASHGVTELSWEEGEEKLSLSRAAQPIAVSSESATPASAAPAAAEPVAAPGAPATPGGKEVISPMVGTFHSAPKPVKVGSKLKKGEVLCVIEAMKLMNDIVMPEDGEIVFLALTENEMVEFGQVIAQYRPL